GGGVTFDEMSRTVLFSTIDVAASKITLYRTEIITGEQLTLPETEGAIEHDLLFNSKNKAAFYITSEGVQVRDNQSGKSEQDRIIGSTQEGESITSIALHPDSSILAIGIFKRMPRPDGGPSATNAGVIRLYDAETGDELTSLDVPEGAITS